MRKTLQIHVAAAAVAALTFSTMWSFAQPADTAVPLPTTAPIGGANDAGVAAAEQAPTTQEALSRASYAIGMEMGARFKQQDVAIDVTQFNAGLTDGLGGTEPKFTDAQVQAAMTTIQTHLAEQQRAKTAAANVAGEKFLAENASKPGVKSTASGLQYITTTEGTGATPGPRDVVKVNYTGKLLDGTTFDSSDKQGRPLEIPLDQVVPGWTEGLQLMKVGGKSTFFIPSKLGFGDQSAGSIPPGSTLIFDVELLDTRAPATRPALPPGLGGLPDLNGGAEPLPSTPGATPLPDAPPTQMP